MPVIDSSKIPTMRQMGPHRGDETFTMYWKSTQLALIIAVTLPSWNHISVYFPLTHAFVTNKCPGRGMKLIHRRINNSRGAQPFLMGLERCVSSSTRIEALPPPKVWIEEAEEGFVDEDENLEPGEICLRSVKSFASGVPTESLSSENEIRVDFEINEQNQQDRRFLSAGALVQRYDCEYEDESDSNENKRQNTTGICDAWMADSILKEGGPNLQLQGALLVLDDLFLDHLQRERENYLIVLESENDNDNQNEGDDDSWGIRALQNFVVNCGEDDDDELYDDPNHRPWRSTSHVAASEMAAVMRGFVPLREIVRVDSIYSAGYYNGDTNGFVLDPLLGLERYRNEDQTTTETIANWLPSKETVARYTTKRFTVARQ